ncbi:MAG: DUF4124 domain-containing protein [Proteobacteria bacterium]|nr:DUF4124 domain-containing protein [Pseudomonadota bacterium]
MVSRTITLLLTMLLANSLATVASAEIYKWEDANGVNFTDDSSSVPEKFREQFFAETDVPPESTTLQVKVRMSRQNKLGASKESMAAVRLANLEQKKIAAEATKQKQLQAEEFQKTLQSLVFYIEILAALGVFLFVIWMITIVDIVRSAFMTPSIKTVWLLLVLLLPLIGMLAYMYCGSQYKCIRMVSRNCSEPGHGVGVISGC